VFYLLGLVSLFADIVYEGGRSVSGSYLDYLGSPAIGPALVGVGDFVGYILRFLAGYAATLYQSSRVLWGFVVAGYAVTAVSIPMLALASTWGAAVALYTVERIGKGLRTPSREVIVAEVSESFGLGKGFGIHELLDQVGAFLGPLAVAIAIARWGYAQAFLMLALPGALSVALVVSASLLYPTLKSVERAEKPTAKLRGLGRPFWLYTLASSALALGFMHWSLVSYYLSSYEILSDPEIGLVFSAAMLVDALAAVPLGHLFDKVKTRLLLVQPVFSFLLVAILLYAPRELVPLVAVCYGIVMCSEESVMRAAVALLADPPRRPMAYGSFGLFFGFAWALGGVVYSAILANKVFMLLYALATSAISFALYAKIARTC